MPLEQDMLKKYDTKLKLAYYRGSTLIQMMVNHHEEEDTVDLLVFKGQFLNIFSMERQDRQKLYETLGKTL